MQGSYCPKTKHQLIQANKERERNLEVGKSGYLYLGDDNEDKWHSPGEPDIEVQPPTFTLRHPSGHRLDTTKSWLPQTLLKLFFCASTIRIIISNTISNAQRTISAGKKFKSSPFTAEDFFVFLPSQFMLDWCRSPLEPTSGEQSGCSTSCFHANA
ncbi:hypothetical protein AMECASPLE_035501 [Ameca splendens]|uniref:Uncharacterized protein n=1 Tax=Ameca splendens TaxID=208324 RepID=A0ABV0YUG9_9TELE